MNSHTALIWSWLNILTKKRYDALVAEYGNLDAALSKLSEPMLRELGCKDDTMYKSLNRLEEFNPEACQAVLDERDLALISIEDDLYPARLREIADAPVFLYYRGDLSVLNQPCIGLVGTRTMSSYGRRIVEHIVPAFISAQTVTVSGLALGVDAAVAKETIAAGGRTVAVLGHGLGSIYPASNRRLADEIIENGGLILSEYPLDIQPGKYTFPARNRIIAGLSLGTVVLEAGEGSGALITAQLALEYGRDVFAVPGQIFDENFAGCHQLLSRGEARLITSPQEVLSELGIHADTSATISTFVPQNETEESIYNALTSMPQSVSDLAEVVSLNAATINAALTMMELNKGVKNVGGGMWVK